MAQRISIGFQASPPLATRVSDDELDRLRGALGSEGWHDIEAEDGAVRVNLGVVVYVQTDRAQHRVGFGLG